MLKRTLTPQHAGCGIAFVYGNERQLSPYCREGTEEDRFNFRYYFDPFVEMHRQAGLDV